MNKNNITLGQVGYGYWGPNLARVYSETQGVHLAALCDQSPARLSAAKSRFRKLQTYSNLQSLLRRPDIDGIIVATPVSTHYKIASLILNSGKHVYIEKPLATSYDEAQALNRLALKKKKIIMVGHTFLYSPPSTKVRELIKSGQLGDIYYINSSRVNLGLFQPDVSVFWDLAPHDISMFLWWLDADPLWVSAQGSSYVRKDIFEVGFATLGFPKGILAHLHVSWLAPLKLRQTAIVGSKRMLLYDDASSTEKVKIFNRGVIHNPETFGEFQLTYRSGDILSPHIDATEPLQLQAAAFVNAIHRKKQPVSGGAFGSRVVRVLEAIQRSVSQNGKRTPLS